MGSRHPAQKERQDADGQIGYWRSFEVMQLDYASRNRSANDGREHLSALREPYLRDLAQRVGFSYARLSNLDAMSEAMRDPRFAARRPIPTDLQ